MITLKNITKFYTVQGKKKLVIDDISLVLNRENIAILGVNGAGKSTLLRMIAGVEPPNKGKIISTASISWPLGSEESLHHLFTGRENAQFICRLFSHSRKEMSAKIDFIKDFTEIYDYFDMPVQTYSWGMKMRLVVSMSLAFEFDYYLIDEVLAVGDAHFKKKCEYTFKSKAERSSLIMASHDIDIIRNFCTKGLLLENGKLTVYDDVEEAIQLYSQPLNKPSF